MYITLISSLCVPDTHDILIIFWNEFVLHLVMATCFSELPLVRIWCTYCNLVSVSNKCVDAKEQNVVVDHDKLLWRKPDYRLRGLDDYSHRDKTTYVWLTPGTHSHKMSLKSDHHRNTHPRKHRKNDNCLQIRPPLTRYLKRGSCAWIDPQRIDWTTNES